MTDARWLIKTAKPTGRSRCPTEIVAAGLKEKETQRTVKGTSHCVFASTRCTAAVRAQMKPDIRIKLPIASMRHKKAKRSPRSG